MRLPKEKGESDDAEPHSYAGTDAERCDLLYFCVHGGSSGAGTDRSAADLDVP